MAKIVIRGTRGLRERYRGVFDAIRDALERTIVLDLWEDVEDRVDDAILDVRDACLPRERRRR